MAKFETTTVLSAPLLIDRKLNVIRDGSVAIRGDQTIATGKLKALSIPRGTRVIRLDDSILMPGLVNAHCHLDFTEMKGQVPAGGDFADWIRRIVAKKQSWSDADYKTSIQRGMRQSVESGTTTIANITCVPHLVSSLDLELAPRIWWFAEQLDLAGMPVDSEKSWNALLRPRFPRQRFSLSPHALYTVTPGLFKKSVAFCNRHRLPWTAHVAESRDEWKMFCDASGPLFDLVQKIGRDMSDCGDTTPFQRLLKHASSASAPALLAHMNCLSNEDLKLLRPRRAHFSVAHCPRSHAFFKHPPFRLNDLRKSGVNVCLGTDSLASNRDLNLFSEMRKLSKTFPNLPARAIVQMATVNGALALGEKRNWPHWADWIAVPMRGSDPFESIIAFAKSPNFVMVSGSIVKKT